MLASAVLPPRRLRPRLPSHTATKYKTPKRDVEEVVKAVRKSPTDMLASPLIEDPSVIVVITADISSTDFISYIPA